MRGLRSVRRFLHPVALEQLDDAAVAQRGDLRVERDAPEHLETVLRRHLIDVALAEHLDRLAAVRAGEVGGVGAEPVYYAAGAEGVAAFC